MSIMLSEERYLRNWWQRVGMDKKCDSCVKIDKMNRWNTGEPKHKKWYLMNTQKKTFVFKCSVCQEMTSFNVSYLNEDTFRLLERIFQVYGLGEFKDFINRFEKYYPILVQEQTLRATLKLSRQLENQE